MDGRKSDEDKLDFTLVPPQLDAAVCRVLMHGQEKYDRDNWKEVPHAPRRYFAALERHINAFKLGEDLDPDSGLHHLAHAACCIAFLLWFFERGANPIGAWRETGYREPIPLTTLLPVPGEKKP